MTISRREAIAKATTDTTVAAGGLLDPGQSRAFLEVVQESSDFGRQIRTENVGTVSGEINKLNTSSRLIRSAPENTDDGYRVEPTFPTVPYSTVKIRLPFEVTEDVYQQNIEREQLERRLVTRFGRQMGLDLDDLNVNGDTAAGAGPDQAFLQIDDGLLKRLATAPHRVDGSTINTGNLSIAHFFATYKALPNKHRQDRGALRWLMSPNRAVDWVETLTERATSAGDAAIGSVEGGPGQRPLGTPILEVPFFPDDRIVLTQARNLVRIMFDQVRRRRVTGDTDWELATRDKRGYIFFVRQDFILEDDDALVDLHSLAAI